MLPRNALRNAVSGSGLCIFSGLVLLADTPANVKVDTPQARAVLDIEQPHQAGSRHERSLNRVLVYLDSGEMKVTAADGKVERQAFQAGDVRWSPAGDPYVTENLSGHPIQIIEVELKNAPPRPPMPVSKLDPTAVDSQHYKVAFENDQVRVLRVHYGPHESGSRHEHILNRVVCYITDQPNGKAREVHVSGAMTHNEENTLDQAVDRIAVELK